eukprot:gene12842-15077_t
MSEEELNDIFTMPSKEFPVYIAPEKVDPEKLNADIDRAIEAMNALNVYNSETISGAPRYQELCKAITVGFGFNRPKKKEEQAHLAAKEKVQRMERSVKVLESTGIVRLRHRRKDLAKRYMDTMKQFILSEKQNPLNLIKDSSALTAANLVQIVQDKIADDTESLDATGNKISFKTKCYQCSTKYTQVHFFYDKLCMKCAKVSYEYRTNTADMTGRIALIIGGRVKIGFQVVLKLLRAGATCIVTTRFSKEATFRFTNEDDFSVWKDRLILYSLDLCDLGAVELFTSYIMANFKYLSIIIHNAAQTIKRPREFYQTATDMQRKPIEAYPQEMQSLMRHDADKTLFFKQHGHSGFIGPYCAQANQQVGATTIYTPMSQDALYIQQDKVDQDIQPIDENPINSWVRRMHEVSTLELLETHAVTSFSPFIISSKLKPMLEEGARVLGSAHIINVSAMEGKFTRFFKNITHTHTNMAKASMNMMTRTSALDYAISNIYMNSCDTGWCTNEQPTPKAAMNVDNRTGIKFDTPLDDVDGASRVLAPIFDGIKTGNHIFGLFLKNYSETSCCAYVTVKTNCPHLEGVGLTFTLGKGTEVVVQCVLAQKDLVVGKSLADIFNDFAAFYRLLTSEPQLRWIGPEKGVIHLATAAILNGIWDLYAKFQEKPLWRIFADMTPEELVGMIDFRYLSDALTKEEALAMLKAIEPTKQERIDKMLAEGYPCYTTSAGWLGYSDEKIKRLCKEAIADGYTHIKIKVGQDIEDDIRRCQLIREQIGPDRKMMVDANQRWDVDQAIQYMHRLAPFNPWWIEEPTSPDDVLGHAAIAKGIAPLKVATGEHCQNRVIFKQLLQANAISFAQPDSCRLGGPTEVITVMLLCAKFNVPVCMHAGGIGLCEISEYVPHLNEHYLHPSIMNNCHYMCPMNPGYGAGLKDQSIKDHTFPTGSVWANKTKQ